MVKDPHISGVQGWLAFLIVALMILGPLMGLGNLSGEFKTMVEQYPELAANPQWQRYERVTWYVYIITALISFSAGYRLWKIHVPESVHFAIVALWLAGPVGNLMYGLSAAYVFDENIFQSGASELLSGLIGSALAAGVWTAYLLRSVRVKNTYRT